MIYFISDAHLGSRLVNDPYGHEMRLVRWLDKVKSDAKAIYMLGDMFDFWFEYQTVMPKGFVRFLGKMAELTDSGIEIHYFTGNHDIWTFGYLEKEIAMLENLQEVCYDSSQVEKIRTQLKRIVLELSVEEQEELLRMIKEGMHE